MRVSLHKPNSVYFSSSRFVRFHSNTSPPPSNNSNAGDDGDDARRLNVEKLFPSAYHVLQRPAEELAMLSAKEIENLWLLKTLMMNQSRRTILNFKRTFYT